jgi:hypothetical protein
MILSACLPDGQGVQKSACPMQAGLPAYPPVPMEPFVLDRQEISGYDNAAFLTVHF